MLLEKCQQLSQLSQKRINLQRYASNREGFKSRQEQIDRAVTAILPLVQYLRAFRQRGITNVDLSQKADNLLKFIANVEAKFQEYPEWIIDNENFNKNNFDSKVKDLQTALGKQLSEAWLVYRSQKMPTTNNEILNLLDRVSAFKPTVQRIRKLDWEIQQSNSIPQSSEDFERVDRLIEQLKQCWEGLNSDEVPEAVLRFVKEAANEGASLGLLTPEVKDWLTKHRLIDSFRIRLT
ncbi:Smr/MutS family protein [Microcoleus vaginatus]|uniref:Smr/MutS family protein n=1 Tax=Microcoleus vaginatus TaxID=119532 RepID=UPI001683B5C7|nr:Smr/MutS family protein [Microcoleus sp. FACHB-84]MBD2008234.1 Smr/MutS family protein [Microcoleus sp. FACHB-45]